MPEIKSAWQKKAAFLAVVLLLAGTLLYQSNARRLRQAERPSKISTRVASARAAIPAMQTSFVGGRQFSTSSAAYIPVDGVLKMREVSRATTEEQVRAFGNRTPLVNEVIRLAPDYFPPNACVISIKKSRERPFGFLINLNQAFANPQFWRGRNRHSSALAFHALARNVAFMNVPKGPALPIQFLIEGRQVANIGTFATIQPLRPDKIVRGSS